MALHRGVFLAGITALTLLAGCEGATSSLPVACPRPSLLGETSDLTRYRQGAARDLTGVEFDARITGVSGGCRAGRGNRSIEVVLSANFAVERGPAAPGRVMEIPWMVAVVDNATDALLGQPQRFRDSVAFGPNETRVTVSGEQVQIVLPVGDTRRAADYRIIVSFVLTPEELELNRRRGPR